LITLRSDISGTSTYTAGGNGGGVGILGQGSSGAKGNPDGGGLSLTGADDPTDGGPGGSGSGGSGKLYGGGGRVLEQTFEAGGGGAVRIIWGPGRAFPSTNTGDVDP
jgi:hypothetical protein